MQNVAKSTSAMRTRRMKCSKSMIAAVLSIVMILTMCAPTAYAAGNPWQGTAQGDVLIKSTATKLADNVYEHEVITNNEAGTKQNIDYLCEIGKSDTIKIVAGYGKNDATSWSLTPTTVQAKAYEESHPGEIVVAGINADFFNMANGQPLGALVMEGVVCNGANGRPYFGITKDGNAVIRYGDDLSDLVTAVGGDIVLIDNGVPIGSDTAYGALAYSRTAIGIKADGTVVTFVTHGLNAPIACGRTYTEIAQMLADAGCVSALALDGGGSATYASRPEGSASLEVRNSPADGAERAVSSSLLVVSVAEATGVFSHAQLSPNNEVYTPGSQIAFEAVGVDTAGLGTEVPEGVTWALAEASAAMGIMDPETGVLTAGAEAGLVTVNLIYEEKVVGETTIEIAKPDHIYFGSEEISLGFEDSSDLGIVVRNAGRDMIYKEGDIIWTVSDDKMGHFVGNTFFSSDSDSVTGKVTATSAFDESVSGEITVIVGKLPTIVWDFEDKVDEAGNPISAADYYINGYNNGTEDIAPLLTHSNYGRGGNESIEIVTIDDDEPVRFGNSSLKLNYDFINCGAVTEGACIGTSDLLQVPGVPTAIGAWVYAPEGVGIDWPNEDGQSGLWLRGYVRDGGGSNKQYDFTLEPKNQLVVDGKEKPGIYWEGWKYVEADITSIQAPYSIQPGMTFRLMYVAGTKMGTKTANAIYFDNLQFVYGTNVDDIEEPFVASMTMNGTPFTDGMTVNTNTITVEAFLQDVQNKYTTGIDDKTVRMYLDGINLGAENNIHEQFKDNYFYSAGDDKLQLAHWTLNDGLHSITIRAKDGFGNEVVDTRYFTVDTSTPIAGTNVSVVPATDTASLGGHMDLLVKATDANVAKSTTIFTLGNLYKNYEVKFSENYDGNVSYSKLEKTITISATRKEGAAAEDNNVIATLSVKVPADIKSDDVFTYTVKGGEFTTTSGVYATYCETEKTLPVGAGYFLAADKLVVGGTPAKITVTDRDGNAAAGVAVNLADGTLVGTSNEQGIVETEMFNAEGAVAADHTIYANGENGLSFNYKLSVFAPQGDATGLPHNVRFNGVNDITTEKNITWFSNTLNSDAQTLQYAVSGSDEWTTVPAETECVFFNMNGNNAINVNSVLLTGLTPDTTYDYKVGTENAVTEVATFKTSAADRDGRFYIIGDIQDSDKDEAKVVVDKINELNAEFDFGVQIGDAIDQAADYIDWSDLGEILGAKKLGGTNMVNIMGNHEYYSDPTAAIAGAVYNSDKTGEGAYYSVEYGDLYIAVINFSNTATPIKEAAEWLAKDAAESDAIWKILCMHQPPYFTNNGGNDPVYEHIPNAAEAGGIDAVFSGHDHSYGVTNLLKDDKINEAEGIVYYLVGAAGSKRYGLSTQDKFDYATIFKKVSADYAATYLDVSYDLDEMTINLYDVEAGLLDTVVLKSECNKKGHTIGCYEPVENLLTCDVCGRVIEKYTGEVFDSENKEYYLLAGKRQTGWVTVGVEMRYYAENGIREKVSIDETPSTCIIDGHCIYTSESGAVKRIDYIDAGGHELKNVSGKQVCSKCGRTQWAMKDCDITLSTVAYTYNGKAKTPSTTIVDPDGNTLVKRPAEYPDYTSQYKNNVKVGTASVTVTAAKYGYYVDMTAWRGNYRENAVVNYTIHPTWPTNGKLVQSDKGYTLTWKSAAFDSECVDEYVIYRSIDEGKWEEIGSTTETSFDVTVDETKDYCFRIYSRAIGSDLNVYESLKYTEASNVALSNINVKFNAESGKPSLTWSSNVKADFVVYRSTTESGEYQKVFTTAGKTYTHVSAKPGKTYYYKISATAGDITVVSDAVSFSFMLEAPVVEITTTNGKPRLTWNHVGADKYEVYRATTEDGEYVKMFTTRGTSYTNTSAVAGETYYYKVIAVSNESAQANSQFSEVKSQLCKLGEIEIKTIVTREADGKPRMTWNKVAGATEYHVYRATTEDGEYVKMFTTRGTSYTNTSAVAGETYYYKVVAVSDKVAENDYSVSEVKAQLCKLAQPIVNSLVRETDGKPRLTWDRVAGADEYHVYRATSADGEFVKMFTTRGRTYTNTSAVAGETYYYKVIAVCADNVEANSGSKVKSQLCELAQPVVYTQVREDGKPRLTWDRVAGADEYHVYRATSEDGSYAKMFTTRGRSYTNTSAVTGETYYYKVLAVCKENAKANNFSEAVSQICE